jgi:Tfp pilus assembly protein PilF
MVHKVHKVARGTRRELVAWFQLGEFDDTYKERQPAYWAAGLNATEHVIAENPAHSSAHHALGKLQWAANNTVKAEKSLRTAISLDPLSSLAGCDVHAETRRHRRRLQNRHQRNHCRNHCKAQELFIQALTINPQDDNTALRHAMSHHFMKELVSYLRESVYRVTYTRSDLHH